MSRSTMRRVGGISMGVLGLSTVSLTLYLTIPMPKYDTSLKENLDPYQYSKFKLNKVDKITEDAKLLKVAIPSDKFSNDFLSIIHHIWVKQPFIQTERPYTPLKPITKDTREIELLVKLYKNSEIGNYINNLKPNDEIELRGPNLSFDLNMFDRNNLVFIVGGTAITPAMQSINSLLSTNSNKQIHLIYSSTNEESTYFKSDLLDMSRKFGNLHLNFINSSKEGHLDMYKLKQSLGLGGSWWSYFDNNNKFDLKDFNFIISGNDRFIQHVAGAKGLFNQGNLGGLLAGFNLNKNQIRKL
ncbi:hypothetical protein E3P77_01891 [Wallemia ichthyophaga]|nr:hypothetical protein E3P77_01891 [Wallemia ichthyophaga]